MGADNLTTAAPNDQQRPAASQRAKLLLSEGLIIAAASAGAYLFAFYYEKGYARVFSIPIQLVNVGLVNVLIFAAVIFGLLSFLIMYLNPLLFAFGVRHARLILLVFLYTCVPIYLYGWADWKHWLIPVGALLLFAVLIAFVIYVLPLIVHRKEGDYAARYAAQAEIDQNAPPSPVETLNQRIGFDVAFIFGLLLISTNLASSAGEAEALQQKLFYVTNTSPEMVVLRIYGDTLIASPFNRSSKEVQKSLHVLKISEGSQLVLIPEEIGPLTPVPATPTASGLAPVIPTPTIAPSPDQSAPSETPIASPTATP